MTPPPEIITLLTQALASLDAGHHKKAKALIKKALRELNDTSKSESIDKHQLEKLVREAESIDLESVMPTET